MAWEDIGKGAGTGASLGSSFGPWGSLAGGLIGGAAGGIFGRNKSDETEIQKKQRELVDQLLGSLNGNGPYASLFQPSEEDFQRSFVDPAKARFKNQIAPQIQQSYIAGGQQRGTGIEGQLARAGVDMDSLLNEHYMNYVQGAQNRQAGALNAILGQNKGGSNGQSWGSAALEGVGGYLSGDSFGKDIGGILDAFNERKYNQSDNLMDTFEAPRKGFENENPIYNPYTGVQSYGGG